MSSSENPAPPAEDRAIRLDQYLKLSGRVRSGGEAKSRIQAGDVLVNGVKEVRRSHKVRPGDEITLDGETRRLETALLSEDGAAP